jgi:pyruvate dehydrogenase E1 component alpha subunit
MAEIGRDQLLDLYYEMVLIRRFEERSKELFHQKKIGGVYLHLYNGQEATGSRCITAPWDHVIGLPYGIAISKAWTETSWPRCSKNDGISGGKGGSMHLADRTRNMWGGYAIVGGHLPLAAGIALKIRYVGGDEVVLCFVGDGATNNGYFHESLNLSAVWDLPVIWLIENNLYGMGTPVEVSSGQPELHRRAAAYGMEDGGRIDGMDLVKVYDAVGQAADYARKKGPILLESMTYRYEGHGMSDKIFHLKAEEMRAYMDRDPITRLRNKLCELFPDCGEQMDKLERRADDMVAESVEYAENSPVPDYDDLVRHVYVNNR